MGLDYDPWAHAHGLALEVTERPLPKRMRGEYLHDQRLIILAPGMSHREARCVLAHEVQHAIAGDCPTVFGPVHQRQEIAARKGAALMLVNVDEYAEAERLREGHLSSIAHDLIVTRRVLMDWRAYCESVSPNWLMARRANSKLTC